MWRDKKEMAREVNKNPAQKPEVYAKFHGSLTV